MENFKVGSPSAVHTVLINKTSILTLWLTQLFLLLFQPEQRDRKVLCIYVPYSSY